MCVLLFDAFSECSLVKKKVGKGVSNIYYWEKLMFSKLVGKEISRKESLKKCTSFEEQKGTRYIRGKVYFGIIVFSCLSSTKPGLLSGFLRKWGWFQRHNEHFPKYLG